MKNEASNEKIIKERGKRLQHKMLLIILVIAIISVGIFTTYAFFQITGGNNQNEKVSVEAGNIELIFSDGNPGFVSELEFGSSAEKTFTITNNGSIDTIARINWKNLVNNYLEGSLTYSLSYTDEENNTTEVIINKNVPRSEEQTTMVLANGINIPVGKTYTLTLTINLNYLESTDQTADINAGFSTEFSIAEDVQHYLETGKATDVLLSKTNDITTRDYNLGKKGEMYTFNHEATDQTEALTDYRYIGNTPNNYINFNDETWRVIGVFTVEGENGEKEQRVKIIRDESIGNAVWNYGLNGVNEWPTSSLSTLLNADAYYNKSISEGKLCGNKYNTPINCDFTEIGLAETAKSQISPTKWYLGGNTGYSLGGPDYYNFERGTDTWSMEKCEELYSSDETKKQEYCTEEKTMRRSTNVIANVGLMYSSDYVYTFAYGVDNICYGNGYDCGMSASGTPSLSWLFNSANQWTITPGSSSFSSATGIMPNGAIITFAPVNGQSYVRPCVYLRSDIEITSGDGSSVENAYTLKVPTN